jgi:hypothetical protein
MGLLSSKTYIHLFKAGAEIEGNPRPGTLRYFGAASGIADPVVTLLKHFQHRCSLR